MASAWTNPCFGKRWRQRADGLYEVEGMGVVMPPAGEQKYSFRRYVRNTWRNFSSEIRAASAERGVPVSWILAIAATETGIASDDPVKQASASGYCCRGVMAIMFTPYPVYKQYGDLTSPEELFDPAKNISTGAAIMKHYMDQGLDLPAIAARYNAGGLCCPGSPTTPTKPGGRVKNAFNLCSASIAGYSYPMVAMMMNNFALREVDIGRAPWLETALWAAGGAAAVSAAGLLYVATR